MLSVDTKRDKDNAYISALRIVWAATERTQIYFH